MALLRRHIKSDFYSGATITSENFEMHHFFPRSFGARKKYIDSIANLVPVTKETNRFLSNRNPSEYIKDLVEKGNFSVQNERFAGALLPIRIGPQGDIKPSILSDDHYEVFVQERGKLILQKIKEVTGNRFADHLGEPYEEI
nr:HNH endonuclease domain-containing protein [Thermus scotoductus]